jgi:minor histocompatibility antigen H13
VLFGLYIVVKFVNKEYLDILISVYFAFLGSLGIFGVLRPPINSAFGGDKLHLFEWSLNYQVWRKTEDREPFSLSFNWLDVGLYAASSAAALAYAFTKKWWLNNLLGMAFSVQGIEMLALGSYMIGVLLLCGLFVYDVFWVFGTEVMVAVAKGLNAPVKILFPKALGVKPMPFSMLGLGDIVIPGIFVALMLRFDSRQQLAGTPYFLSNLLAYELGLVATVGVMHFFDAAQPALLYLVPACIGASLLCAAVRGETPLLLKYSEEKKEEAPAESKKEQ